MRPDQTTGLPERPLKLELTETLLMQNLQLATGHLAQLHDDCPAPDLR